MLTERLWYREKHPCGPAFSTAVLQSWLSRSHRDQGFSSVFIFWLVTWRKVAPKAAIFVYWSNCDKGHVELSWSWRHGVLKGRC